MLFYWVKMNLNNPLGSAGSSLLSAILFARAHATRSAQSSPTRRPKPTFTHNVIERTTSLPCLGVARPTPYTPKLKGEGKSKKPKARIKKTCSCGAVSKIEPNQAFLREINEKRRKKVGFVFTRVLKKIKLQQQESVAGSGAAASVSI